MAFIVIMTVCMIYFLLIHIGFMITNKTTIDYLEKEKFRKEKLNIFNVGVYANIRQVLGPFLLWLIPIGHGTEGNGYTFKVNKSYLDINNKIQ
jgi:hypothetical protein